MDLQGLHEQAISIIDHLQDDLWHISLELYEKPEIGFQEHYASQLLTKTLASAGFQVEKPIGGLETAFKASFIGTQKKPVVAFLAEYDALPGLGHACGHNLIAAASVGAGLSLATLLEPLPGQVQVIGTPAEEGGGGKIILANAGIFQGVDAAMMFHPASKNMVLRGSLASARLVVEFFGKAAHAAASPEVGVNALDACILAFNNINALRQHFRQRDRVAGIITHGGEAVNIIPAYTRAVFSVRGTSDRRRDLLMQKVIACCQAGAQATGCQIKYDTSPGYAEIIPNPTIARLFSKNMVNIGRSVVDPDPNESMGSTDMGDVSHLVPAIHPYLAVVPETVPGHSDEFREICITQAGRSAMLDAAKSLALTAIDLLTHPEFLTAARQELDKALATSSPNHTQPR